MLILKMLFMVICVVEIGSFSVVYSSIVSDVVRVMYSVCVGFSCVILLLIICIRWLLNSIMFMVMFSFVSSSMVKVDSGVCFLGLILLSVIISGFVILVVLFVLWLKFMMIVVMISGMFSSCFSLIDFLLLFCF